MEKVLVRWVDSRQPTPQWEYVEQIADQSVVVCETIGFVINKDNQKIVIAQNIGDNGNQVSGVMVIPVRSIEKIKVISS